MPVSRLLSSQYRRLHWGLYVTSETADTLELRSAAALLLVPQGSAISHSSALALRGLTLVADAATHVCVPDSGPAPRSLERLVVHRPRIPFAASLQRGITVTAPARTLLDVAGGLTDDEIVVVADHLARQAGGVAALRDEVESTARHRWRPRVLRALARLATAWTPRRRPG